MRKMIDMAEKYKICANCGSKVDVTYNFCPNCKSQSFKSQPERVQTRVPSRAAQTLLYWNYDGNYVLSKSKVGAIGVFLFFFISGIISPAPAVMYVVALIIAALVYVIGFAIHMMKGRPSEAVIEYNNYGTVPDLLHLFFFWQNKQTGEFVPSKTKILSFLIFVVFCLICAFGYSSATFAVVIIFGLFFEIPAFLVGCGIHKLTNPNPTNPKRVETESPKKISRNKKIMPKIRRQTKSEPPKVETVSKFTEYEDQIEELKVEYSSKEKIARDLIEKRFEPPQITYTRFISMVDKASEVFENESESALNILKLASEDSPRIDSEIKSKIKIMKSIIEKTDDLTNELILSMDSSDEDDVDNLIGDMENLVSSVKDYEN